ncbi:MAG: mechanosensitive ion channel family protein [Bryobacteraceae bacterium]|nr:mechanosensitive ion channel family protein [Bryobacteraceae bacterium]
MTREQVLIFSAATLVALCVRLILIRLLRPVRKHKAGELLLSTISGPSILWCIAIGLALAIQNTGVSEETKQWAEKGIGAFVTISIGLVAASTAVQLIAVYGERRSLRIAGLSRTLINVVIFSIVALTVMSQFGVQITPVLTALGVGGLAVALALQDTLANFFAGIHILVEEPIRVGDFIRLSEKEEGTVRDIGWRTTRIATFANTTLVVPNKTIASANVVNFSLPDLRVSAEIAIFSHHDVDAGKIAAIALEIATTTKSVLADPAPVVLFDPGVLQTHLQLKLVLEVPNIMERGRVQSEIRSRLHERFREEGISFPVVKP